MPHPRFAAISNCSRFCRYLASALISRKVVKIVATTTSLRFGPILEAATRTFLAICLRCCIGGAAACGIVSESGNDPTACEEYGPGKEEGADAGAYKKIRVFWGNQ